MKRILLLAAILLPLSLWVYVENRAAAEKRTASITIGNKTIRYAPPAGYALVTDEWAPGFLASLRQSMHETDIRLVAVYAPNAIHERAEQTPETATMDMHLMVTTNSNLENWTFTRELFAALRETYRHSPELLIRKAGTETRETPRGLGEPVITDSLVLYGFQMFNNKGKTVYGVIAILHTGQKIVNLQLFELGESDDVMPTLIEDMQSVIESMDFPSQRFRKPMRFILTGLALVAFFVAFGYLLLAHSRAFPALREQDENKFKKTP